MKETFTLWVVVKKVMNISYQAVDENGNSLEFTNIVSGSRNILEDSTIAESVSDSKLDQLNSVTCTNLAKEFAYWAVYVDGEYKQFDLEKDPILIEYISSGNRIILYAVFKDKEMSL